MKNVTGINRSAAVSYLLLIKTLAKFYVSLSGVLGQEGTFVYFKDTKKISRVE